MLVKTRSIGVQTSEVTDSPYKEKELLRKYQQLQHESQCDKAEIKMLKATNDYLRLRYHYYTNAKIQDKYGYSPLSTRPAVRNKKKPYVVR